MDKNQFLQRYAVDRKGTSCNKWDQLGARFGHSDLVPMWVADMDFRSCEAVVEALEKRAAHGVYGYSYVPDSYYKALSDWMEKHFSFPINRDWVRFSSGVVPALFRFIDCFTDPGDSVAIFTPVYYPFHRAVQHTGRKLVKVELQHEDGRYSIDYDAFEKAVLEENVKMLLFCSPHNPASRVWTEQELARLFALCEKYNVLIASDEIHQDFVFEPHRHTPALKVEGGRYTKRILLVTAASKTFNLAALLHSNIIIPDEDLRARYDAYNAIHPLGDSNIFGALATEAAYRDGGAWYEGVKEVIYSNYQYLKQRLAQELPAVVVADLQGTYLPMLDLRAILPEGVGTETVSVNGMPAAKNVVDFVQNRCRLAVDYGEWFGENYAGFIRLNLGTTPEMVEKTVDAIVREAARG
uniref:MalY/PatB family protein n=1 Tax=Ndongobacter massiliensis TaxID=1871025 RepID=UPI00093170CF|nr:MalY/PatB family protein [Ndongobacter massiliensis]